MFNYIWPIALVVISNVLYQICAKSVPKEVNPFATLTVAYTIGAISSLIMYFTLNKHTNFIKDITKMNWASYILGFTVVGLEVGFIYAYKAGWQVSKASIVQSSFLAVALIFTGLFIFNESITWNKLLGVVICLIGLVFINLK